jgi:hypothetical protein
MDMLEQVYMKMVTKNNDVITESDDTVKTKVKAGDGFEGSENATIKSVKSPEPTAADGIKQKKPVEGPSGDDEAGKPKKLSGGKMGMKKEDMETKTNEIPLTFDKLYSKVINEADEDVVPAPDIEGADFSEEEGDFDSTADGEGELEEEIDVASELRLLADRLTEIAEKISGGEPTDELGDDMDADMGDDLGGDAGIEAEFSANESKVHTEAIKSEPTPKAAKKTTLGPKMSQKPKNKIGNSGAKKAVTPTAGKDRTGTPSVASKTTLGPKMSQNPSGTGPAVKGSNASLIS